MKIPLTITTPLSPIYKGEVDFITVTTEDGEITILPKHIPLVSVLRVGYVLVNEEGKKHYFAIDGGILEVRHDGSVVILSQRSEHADDIDIQRAEEAIQRAKRYLEEEKKVLSRKEYKHLLHILKKEENRIHVAKKGQRR